MRNTSRTTTASTKCTTPSNYSINTSGMRTGFSNSSSTGVATELQDPFIYIAVLGVIAGIAIIMVIVLCAIYVCRIPLLQPCSYNLFKKPAFLKGEATKDILCGEADTEVLVNIDTSTSTTSMQDDLKVNPSYFEIQCRPSEYCLLELQDSSDATVTNSHDAKSDHNMNYEEIVRETSSLVKLKQISGSEPLLGIFKPQKDLRDSTNGNYDVTEHQYNSIILLGDNIYNNP